MKFKKYLSEVFDDPYEWDKTKDSSELMRFVFNSNGDRIKLVIEFDDLKNAEIEFTRNKTTELTGDGDAYKIFATIKDIFQKNKNNIKSKSKAIIFSAKSNDTGRVKFYNTVSKWIKKEYNGSNIKKENITSDNSKYVQYIIEL